MRLRHPLAVISFLDRVGAPVERRLRECGLPAYFLEPDALVPLTRVWTFFDRASRLDVPSVGWRASGSLGKPNLGDGLLSKLERAPTLYGALHQLQSLAARESSHIRFGIRERTRDILFHMHHPGRAGAPGYVQAQLYQLRVVLSLVRHFVGPSWQPRVLGLESDHIPKILEEDLPNCRILPGQRVGFLAIARDHLATSVRHWSPEQAEVGGQAPSPISDEAEALRVLLRPYLTEGYPTLEFAAALLGTSPRTLARRLSALGTGYRQLVDETRFETAKGFVCESDVPLAEVAWRVGFEDQSHFTRMFRRVGGVTPGRLRRAAVRGR